MPARVSHFFGSTVSTTQGSGRRSLLVFYHTVRRCFNFPRPGRLIGGTRVPKNVCAGVMTRLGRLKRLSLLRGTVSLVPRIHVSTNLPPLMAPADRVVKTRTMSYTLSRLGKHPVCDGPSGRFITLMGKRCKGAPIPVSPRFHLGVANSQSRIPCSPSSCRVRRGPMVRRINIRLTRGRGRILLLRLFPVVTRGFLTGGGRGRTRITA